MALKNNVEKEILWALRSLNDEAHCHVSTPMVAKFIKWQNLIYMYWYNRTQDLLILTILAVACRDHEMNQFCSLLSIKYYMSKWLKLNSSVSKNKLKMLRCWHTSMEKQEAHGSHHSPERQFLAIYLLEQRWSYLYTSILVQKKIQKDYCA